MTRTPPRTACERVLIYPNDTWIGLDLSLKSNRESYADKGISAEFWQTSCDNVADSQNSLCVMSCF